MLRAVAEGSVTAGVLPMPEDAEDDPWWMRLAGSDASQLRVIARLPFCQNPDGRFEDLESLVIARFDIEESGDDQSLFAVATSAEISRDSLNRSEDRRVGKECSSRWSPYHLKTNATH